MSHLTRMSTADTGLLVIDVQEKLVPKIHAADAVVANIAFLIDAARALSMPVQATEQYPKGLGATVPPLCLASFAGRLSCRVRNADGLQRSHLKNNLRGNVDCYRRHAVSVIRWGDTQLNERLM